MKKLLVGFVCFIIVLLILCCGCSIEPVEIEAPKKPIKVEMIIGTCDAKTHNG